MALTRVYLPDGYIMKVYQDTLQYIHRRKLNARDVYKLVPRDIMHFFALYTTWVIANFQTKKTIGSPEMISVVTTLCVLPLV